MLAPELSSAGIARSVLVQAAASTAETDFMLELASQHDFIGGVVGWCDLADPASTEQLEAWARHPKFKGVRPVLQDLEDPEWILHGPRPEVLDALERLGLRFDALVRAAQLPALLRFVAARPALPVVVDHAAKPPGWNPGWELHMQALAERPQVFCKLSGLWTEMPRDAVPTVWNTLLEQFGAERLMWGSDWPVLLLAGDYQAWWTAARSLVYALPPADRAAVLGGTAARFYRL
jgi:L-fuconolactonase